MSTNISKAKREELLKQVAEIRNKLMEHQDENTNQLLVYLSNIEKDINGKKYGLVFEEHLEAVDELLENNVPVLIENESLKIDNGGQQNFLIEGDNLASLKLLEKTHKGKIDFIYIDPPYNTEHKDFVYDDTFVAADDKFKHSKWLSFMSARLHIAKKLMKSEAVIFISIGEQEVAQLTLLCDDIFGRSNFLSIIARISKTASDKGSIFAPSCDYIVCYAKDKTKIDVSNFYDEVDETLYTKIDERGRRYRDDVAFYQSSLDPMRGCVNQRYFVSAPDGSFLIPPGLNSPATVEDGAKISPVTKEDKVWRWSVDTYLNQKDLLVFKETKTSPLLDEHGNQAKYNIYTKSFLDEREKKGVKPRNFLVDKKFLNRRGQDYLKTLDIEFSYSKPKELINHLISISHLPKNAIVLDFFAGSGTTGESVLDLKNNNIFILCTNNENNICRDVTYERIKRVIAKEDYKASLKYYKVDFVPITEQVYYEYADKLLLHIKELVELENGLDFDGNKKVAICLIDEDLQEFVTSLGDSTTYKAVYVGHDVFVTPEMESKLNTLGIKINIIPDYYYGELRG